MVASERERLAKLDAQEIVELVPEDKVARSEASPSPSESDVGPIDDRSSIGQHRKTRIGTSMRYSSDAPSIENVLDHTGRGQSECL